MNNKWMQGHGWGSQRLLCNYRNLFSQISYANSLHELYFAKKNSVMKLVLTTLFDPTQKTTDNNVFKSIKSCSVRHRRGYEACIISKTDCPLENTSSKEHSAEDCSAS